MRNILIHIGSATLGLLIIFIPYMFAVSICQGWKSFYVFIFCMGSIVDSIAITTVIDKMAKDGE